MYDAPHQFEPLLPSSLKQEPSPFESARSGARRHPACRSAGSASLARFAARDEFLLHESHRRAAHASAGNRAGAGPYFSGNADLAARQRLALAHIEAEAEVEKRYVGDEGACQLYSVTAVCDLHRELFSRLPAEDLAAAEGEPIVPGSLRGARRFRSASTRRRRPSRACRHCSGAGASFTAASVVARRRCWHWRRLHQRLGWIHPFVHGNGRVMR